MRAMDVLLRDLADTDGVADTHASASRGARSTRRTALRWNIRGPSLLHQALAAFAIRPLSVALILTIVEGTGVEYADCMLLYCTPHWTRLRGANGVRSKRRSAARRYLRCGILRSEWSVTAS